MPIRFERFNNGILLSGEAGEYHFMSVKDFDALISHHLAHDCTLFADLKSKNLVATNDLAQSIDMTATRYRTRKSFLDLFTVLHMLVVTVRCNHRCEYCQVSCEDEDAKRYDMSPETAKRAVEFAFKAPAQELKIEFQGGEPLLNWAAVEAAVLHAKSLNETYKKDLSFVVCTNLTLMDEEKLAFIKQHNISVSTSLDGPQTLHDSNRRMRLGGDGSHRLFLKKLDLTRKNLGHNAVSALMTTSALTIGQMKNVVDEYVRLGFSGMFIRSLNPYGFAREQQNTLGYSMEDFVKAYKDTLLYIIDINLSGTYFSEYFTSLLLSRILTPFSTGFVDLQSPSGAGISGVIYDYNGDVYPADEARMLSRMGDKRFLMGNIQDKYESVFNGSVLTELVYKSCLEIMPVCADCVYNPYCGSDPIRNYLETGDIVGKRPNTPFCEKHKSIFNFLFDLLLKNDRDVMDVFWSWLTRRPLQEIRHEAS